MTRKQASKLKPWLVSSPNTKFGDLTPAQQQEVIKEAIEKTKASLKADGFTIHEEGQKGKR